MILEVYEKLELKSIVMLLRFKCKLRLKGI